MKNMMRKKLEQHEEVHQALFDSGDMEIVKKIVTYPPGDSFWDAGDDGTGQNEMGKIWMELREEIR
jgi:predicted NAD-dependent protein-ADP-ribosyltransferase YbiA (DUF1768 family)